MNRALLKSLIQSMGIQLSRYRPLRDPRVARQLWLHSNNISRVLDVGANIGGYALELRRYGFEGQIVSFEPLSSAFALLQKNSATDPKWIAVNKALGNVCGAKEINVAGNSSSSSLLAMAPRHQAAAPESRYVEKELVSLSTLDSECESAGIDCSGAFMKIDVQGYTFPVLDGAKDSLRKLRGLQVELSLVPLYEGEPLAEEVIARLRGEGFFPVLVIPVLTDMNNGQHLQVDAIFSRE